MVDIPEIIILAVIGADIAVTELWEGATMRKQLDRHSEIQGMQLVEIRRKYQGGGLWVSSGDLHRGPPAITSATARAAGGRLHRYHHVGCGQHLAQGKNIGTSCDTTVVIDISSTTNTSPFLYLFHSETLNSITSKNVSSNRAIFHW